MFFPLSSSNSFVTLGVISAIPLYPKAPKCTAIFIFAIHMYKIICKKKRLFSSPPFLFSEVRKLSGNFPNECKTFANLHQQTEGRELSARIPAGSSSRLPESPLGKQCESLQRCPLRTQLLVWDTQWLSTPQGEKKSTNKLGVISS